MSVNSSSSMSRAEQLRQRRSQKTQPRVTPVKKSTPVAPRHQPAVMRGFQSSASIPLRKAKPMKVRKQYYYSLGANGAEIRLPAIPLINPGSRLVSAILLVVGLLALYMLGFGSQFEVSHFKVEGIQRLTYGEFEAVLKLEGSQIIEFDPQHATAALAKAYPELSSIHISVGLPAEVTIQVVERQPVIAWEAGGNTIYWLDAEGVILPQRGDAGELLWIESDQIPPLAALPAAAQTAQDNPAAATSPTEIWGRVADTQVLKAINDLLLRLPPESKLVYNSMNGLGWQDPRGWEVYIGKNLENFEQKLTVYESIVENFEKQGVYPQELVSVEFINAPFYR